MTSSLNIDAFLGVSIGVVALLFYLSSIPHTIMSGDSAELTYVIQTFQTAHPPGYPLYIMVSRFLLFLTGNTPWFVNATSAIYTSLSLSILYLFIRQRGINKLPALTSVICLGFSYPIWIISIKTEVYSFLILLFALVLLVWNQVIETDSYLGLIWFLAGLSLTHHPLNVLGVILAIHATNRTTDGFSARHVFLFVLPLTLYLTLLIPGSGEPFNWPYIGSVRALMDHMLGGSFYRFFVAGGIWGLVEQIQSITLSHLLAFPVLVFPSILAGYIFMEPDDEILLFSQALVLLLLVFYAVPDVQEFLVPSYVIGAYFLALFLDEVSLLSFTGTVALSFLLFLSVFLGAWFVSLRYDWSDYNFPERYAKKTETTINKHSLVLSDWSHYTLLRYYQTRHDRLNELQLLTPTHHFSDWPRIISQFLRRDLRVYTTVSDWDIPRGLSLNRVGYLYRVKSVNK